MELSDLVKASISMAERVKNLKERYVLKDISGYLRIQPRVKILRGLRGVGKTTLLLQLLNRLDGKGIYFSADWPTITSEGIFAVGKAAAESGYTHLFIDEVHTYPSWQSEVKALHDQFGDIQIFCSGSAAVAFTPDRRQKMFDIEPMAFGEFLELGFGTVLEAQKNAWKSEEQSVAFVAKHYPLIEERFTLYITSGGFPSSFSLQGEDSLKAIYYSIHKSIREDSVSFLKMSSEKVFAMEKLAILVATSPPGELNISSLSNSLAVSKSIVYEIIDGLVQMKILRLIRPDSRGKNLVRSEPKLLFTHPNIRAAFCHMLKREWLKGPSREETCLFGLEINGWSFHTIKGEKANPDYVIEKGQEHLVIEIGGPSKKYSQLKEFEKRLVVKDDQLKALLL